MNVNGDIDLNCECNDSNSRSPHTQIICRSHKAMKVVNTNIGSKNNGVLLNVIPVKIRRPGRSKYVTTNVAFDYRINQSFNRQSLTEKLGLYGPKPEFEVNLSVSVMPMKLGKAIQGLEFSNYDGLEYVSLPSLFCTNCITVDKSHNSNKPDFAGLKCAESSQLPEIGLLIGKCNIKLLKSLTIRRKSNDFSGVQMAANRPIDCSKNRQSQVFKSECISKGKSISPGLIYADFGELSNKVNVKTPKPTLSLQSRLMNDELDETNPLINNGFGFLSKICVQNLKRLKVCLLKIVSRYKHTCCLGGIVANEFDERVAKNKPTLDRNCHICCDASHSSKIMRDCPTLYSKCLSRQVLSQGTSLIVCSQTRNFLQCLWWQFLWYWLLRLVVIVTSLGECVSMSALSNWE